MTRFPTLISIDYSATLAIVRLAIKWFQHSKWWCEPNPTCITWNVSHVKRAIIGKSMRRNPAGLSAQLTKPLPHFSSLPNTNRFCVGDRFYLCDNKILCECDYEDRQMRLQGNPQTVNSNNNSNEIINQNLKRSSNETKASTSSQKRYATATNQTNLVSPFHPNDYINYNEMRRIVDPPIGVRWTKKTWE